MNLLVLGGTQFVGRAIVEAALAAGHGVSVFHRGRSPAVFSRAVETLHGDRAGELDSLRGRRWDAVIDTSGYAYGEVRATAELLSDAVEHYALVSTIAVYADLSGSRLSESAPTKPADRSGSGFTPSAYGAMKVGCEVAVREALPERHLVVRPGIIVGPDDYTDRFPFWCRRVAAGGEVLGPGDPDRPVQWIDARDLAAWLVSAVGRRLAGVFNATGPAEATTLSEMLAGIRQATGSDARFTWVPEAFLERNGSEPERDFPFFLPADRTGTFSVDSDLAAAEGLRHRPLAETVKDTLFWDAGRAADERVAGLPIERELHLLRAWHAR